MSEPVTKIDVDDVLSSVRRMVNENRVTDASQEVSGESRLVLTPQLRVPSEEVLRLEPQHAKAAAEKDDAEVPLASHEIDLESEGAPVDLASTNVTKAKPAPYSTRKQGKMWNSHNFGVFELSAKIAALETAIGRFPGPWEPDGTGLDAYAGTKQPAMDWPGTRDLDATGAPMPKAAAAPETEEAATDPLADPTGQAADDGLDEEQVIDEAALRDLVAEIVRSELQGPLGERITRNVRKLVRLEIQRALAARDLE
jgi:hypothetical protein